ncbi:MULTISPECIES: M14 family zinc carboxypeptidase [unclassified Streptomyces]|uniref:M14 family zinc carboxypeptidase n=1 Tax=unclassified Streptomyces TaxID=2593676 RepID=UPI0022531889|nr:MULTISPECIES: M14 family zinc carboxypeptidase [unclassified Streptomyces]MCX4991164.1 M14 family zinc carboxypeptidase [Streptomyces sp. NBC_00568]MCX5003599.1 M14 family zinc carboxypeptidase [Streptomyces sp. NBC_00638]
MRLPKPRRPQPRAALLAAVAAVAAGSLVLAPTSATADRRPPVREGAAAADSAARAPASAARAALTAPVTGLSASTRGYPRQQVLTPDPVNLADKSIKLGLTPYHAIAPKLNALQRLGDRVSVEVAGRSAGGHRLFLVTVTAPESAARTRAQERMRELIENAPGAAAGDPAVKSGYKTPVFFNSNIHGNEWEGTDAALSVIEQLATDTDARTKDLLAHSRIYFNITANPDGRIAGTRANANGFDLNRDLITASQPEARAMRQIAIDKQPAVMLDLHGYVNGTLIEPTTPPHGENYEYDLFLKNTYANALGMEAAVNGLGYTPAADGVEPAQIPFRDQQEGWDDWPPIFTPQYAAFHGTVAAHTVEIPMNVNGTAYDTLPVTELRRRSAINVDVAGAALRATLDFARTHRTSLIADQIEVFRRGATGAAQVPVSAETVPGVPGIGPEDVYTTDFPSAYVIPAGAAQRSGAAAARLVDHLIANDVRVTRAARGFRLAGRSYPKGSFVVSLRQPKRGLANVMLADGRDISDKVSTMYDISGWSLGRLWGATVERVESGGLSALPLRAVDAAPRAGRVAARGDLRLRLGTPQEVAALNSLLKQGVPVRQDGDGGVVVPASARAKAVEAARAYDVSFDAAGAARDDSSGAAARGVPLRRVRVAAAVTPGELFALREMNFDVVPVSTAILDAGFDWSAADVLFVSSGLDHAALTPAARSALDTFLGTHGLVGRGATGAALNAAAGLLDVRPVEGDQDANGVVRVVNSGGSVTAGAPDHSFVYAPVWFTDPGSGVRVEQSYATGDPLVSGHWRPLADGSGGPTAAGGRASVVSGPRAVLFGTEPLFRDHPKGEFPQVARALLTVSRGL